MRYLISTICIALFLWGCDNAAAVPDKPIVVRKKIAAKKVRTAKVRKQKAVRTAKAKPVAKKQTRTIAAKPDKTRPTSNNQPPVKQDTSSQPRIAKKAKTAPVQSSPPSRLKQKKAGDQTQIGHNGNKAGSAKGWQGGSRKKIKIL